MHAEITALREEIAVLKAEQRRMACRLQESEDYRDLMNLQSAYGYYVDKAMWDKAADLFAEDGTLEIAGRGIYVGRERVRAYLTRLPEYGYGVIFNHMQLQPVIHINSECGTAKARWRTFIMIGWLGKEARWGEATYENEYSRENGKWRIAKLHGIINFYAEYDKGWHKGGIPLLRSVDGLKPDLQPSFNYEAYPEPVVAPFHYDEP
ncbi:nuclear transport factor 2 family protein [Altericroceibacterium spongiae]|uniref:Nuclear transport factor 2 family protein n=1 Tax=Altericroceibacterium spongiae TaxID=2320269 RepID=A0A420EPH8_9SPHN|nr:nuclear transport factor 2 family protein [Altericroceibacterium spongiae]RKF22582.1 nuclear transport factor 2 family protein [Altericroceibacterium spongiae]